MQIFQKSVIQKYLKSPDNKKIEKAYLKFKESYSLAKIDKIIYRLYELSENDIATIENEINK